MKLFSVTFILCLTYFQAITSFPVNENGVNPMENPKLFGGDMVGVKFDDDRKAVPADSMRWPGGIVYYAIDNSLAGQTTLIHQAMDHITKNVPCIKFQQRTNQRDYVYFYLGNGCFSNVGRTGGQQMLSLGNGCHWPRTAVHEIMHATGFYHEQNRSDRDGYITIHWENIDQAKWSQFKLLQPNENRLFTPFDFDSVMLYGPTAFTKNNGITMSSKISGKPVVDHPQSQGLSANDIYSLKKLYGCL